MHLVQIHALLEPGFLGVLLLLICLAFLAVCVCVCSLVFDEVSVTWDVVCVW